MSLISKMTDNLIISQNGQTIRLFLWIYSQFDSFYEYQLIWIFIRMYYQVSSLFMTDSVIFYSFGLATP